MAIHERSVMMLGRIRERNHRFMQERLKEHGYGELAPSHGAIVATLLKKGTLTMSTLASIIDKRKPTVTVLVGKLEKLGLVRSDRDESDSRIVNVTLTDKGNAFADVMNNITKEVVKRATRDISESEAEVFSNVLLKIHSNLEDFA